MTGGPAFRPDLYRGTAAYYDRYRLPYPPALIDELCRRVAPDGTGRLLDLACGPGTVTFALCDRFADVLAIDQEPETIDFARRKATERGVHNVRWITGRAEDVDPDEQFDLVTIGNAFHRLDRPHVARIAARVLRTGGHLALLWCELPQQGTDPWQQTFNALTVDWMQRLDATDRIPADFEAHLAVPNAEVLAEAGFTDVQHHEFEHDHDWTADELIGLTYSTSILPRAVLGDRAAEFEADLRARLSAVEPSGVFRGARELCVRPRVPLKMPGCATRERRRRWRPRNTGGRSRRSAPARPTSS